VFGKLRGETGDGRGDRHHQSPRRNRAWAGWFRVSPYSVRRQNRFDETRRPGRSVVPFDEHQYGLCRRRITDCVSSGKIASSSAKLRLLAKISGCWSKCGARGLDLPRLSLPLRWRVDSTRYKHDRTARTPVSERGLVPRENTAFLGAVRDSGSSAGGVV